jgi:hypothetical protein
MPKLHSWRGAVSWIGAKKSGEMGVRGGASTALPPGFVRSKPQRRWRALKNGEFGVGDASTNCADLALAKHDTTFGQVVGREFHSDAIAGDNADKMLSHPASDVRHD